MYDCLIMFTVPSEQPTSSLSLISSLLLRPEETQQPANGDGFSANNTNSGLDNNGISPSGIAAITTIASILLILVVLVITLALGIVIYRRWKVNQVKKSLLQMHPAHLAMGTSKVLLCCVVHSMTTYVPAVRLQTTQHMICQCWAKTTGSSSP